jgi:hypothetical protein
MRYSDYVGARLVLALSAFRFPILVLFSIIIFNGRCDIARFTRFIGVFCLLRCLCFGEILSAGGVAG